MKKHGCLWWLFIGWWWTPITLPFRIIAQRRKQPKPTEAPVVVTSPATRKKPEGETHKVAGTSYRQEALRALGELNEDYSKTKKQLLAEGLTDEWVYEYEFSTRKAELVPEPENPHDPNAIKVLADGVHIGYIKSGSCAHIRKLQREGRIERVVCDIRGGRSKMLAGDDDGESYNWEKDELPFYARLTVYTKPEN